MGSPPTGRVVFLFTDIEGSTRRWEQYPDLMRVALARHDQILRGAIERHEGYVFKTIGDAFCAAFPSVPEALAAALEAQREILAEAWNVPEGIRVRMGLHAGETVERDGDYFGPPVNRVARLMSAGHGGQTLLSAAVRELLGEVLPSGVALRDMGERRLKDLGRPEHIYQLEAPDLPNSFPPLKTLDARPNNIPPQPNALVGREREAEAARKLLLRRDVRMVTFSGPGGTGKTRLALQVAADVIDFFEDGVYFVELADVRDPDLFPSTVAHAIELKEEGGETVLQQLKRHIGDKRLLLVLDNFEQVLPAAPVVGELLSACPHLEILVTSRAVLRVYGEQEFPVAPLGLPNLRRLPPPDPLLRDYPAIALFVQRAGAVKPDFSLTDDNRRAVAEICTRLDGLPLAIELAASRVKLLPPQAILTRLESALKLLTGGARDLPARQQTLRGAIAWSYDLMEPAEKRLWQRLSIFQGGCTLEAAEAVGAGDGALDLDVLDGLAALTDRSLLRQEETHGEPRFRMLQTIREFAGECLQQSGEADEAAARHAAYFRQLAVDAEPLLESSEPGVLQQLETEHDNLRAALDFLAGSGRAASALEMAGALWRFWSSRGHLAEGRERLHELLELVPDRTPDRAKALRGAGVLALDQGNYAAARALCEDSRQISLTLEDRKGLADCCNDLGLVEKEVGDYPKAEEYFQLAYRGCRELGAELGMAKAGNNLGLMAERRGDFERARGHYEECLTRQRRLRNRAEIARALTNLGNIARTQGDLVQARERYDESLALRRELGNLQGIASSLNALGMVEMFQGRLEEARAHFLEALERVREIEQRGWEPALLGNLGEVSEQLGDDEEARRCLQESLAIDRELGSPSGVAYTLGALGRLNTRLGDLETARRCLRECLDTLHRLGEPVHVAFTLASWAELEASDNRPEKALVLSAAAAAMRDSLGAPLPERLREAHERAMRTARERLDAAAAERAVSEGREMPPDRAVEYALLAPAA